MNRRKLFQLLGMFGAWTALPAQAHRGILKIDETLGAIPHFEDALDGISSVCIAWGSQNVTDGWTQIKVIGIGASGQLFANHLVHSENPFFDCCKSITSFEDFRSIASGTHMLFLAVDSTMPQVLKIADFISQSCDILGNPGMTVTLIDVGAPTNRAKARCESRLQVDGVRALESFSSVTGGIAKILNVEGYVGIDFEDVRTVLAECGLDSRMSVGSASGADRAKRAALQALSSAQSQSSFRPDSNGTLLLIGAFHADDTERSVPARTSLSSLAYSEFQVITKLIHQEAHLNADAHFVCGTYSDESLGDRLHVTLITSR